jgi:hypothetical protein
VTAAIATGDRCEGFDYRIYHRFHQEQELPYLQATRPAPEEGDWPPWLRRLVERLAYDSPRRQHKTKPQRAAELIEQMDASERAPDVYTVDRALFASAGIETIEKHGKPGLADSEKTRWVFWQGQTFDCETFAQSRPDEAYRPVTLRRRGQEKSYWVFSCVVRYPRNTARSGWRSSMTTRTGRANRSIVSPGTCPGVPQRSSRCAVIVGTLNRCMRESNSSGERKTVDCKPKPASDGT